jgi:FKBP-type peptidyl-prolyl cis-trans isomerase
MKKQIVFFTLIVLSTVSVHAQSKKGTTNDTKAKLVASKDEGYTMTPNGMEYKIVYDAPGDVKPKVGDYLSAHLLSKVEDSVLFSTRQVLNNAPAEVQIMAQPGKGDVLEGFMYMTVGDSAIFRFSVDTLMKMPNMQPLPWMKPGTGQKIYYYVVLTGVKSADAKQKEMEEAQAKQKETDDKLIQDYLAKNSITATKTESGLYYSIKKEGSGTKAEKGDTVVVNYTGINLDGRKFDSNVDSAFGHPGQPFEFPVGMGRVIKGWDEGFMLLKKGTKATLYIPSGLAYGANSPDENRIPKNGILLFDVEMVNVKKPEGSMFIQAKPATPKKK